MSLQVLHYCRPPIAPVGTAWLCPECWCTYRFRPVAVSELGGRVLNLWVLSGRPAATTVGILRGRR